MHCLTKTLTLLRRMEIGMALRIKPIMSREILYREQLKTGLLERAFNTSSFKSDEKMNKLKHYC